MRKWKLFLCFKSWQNLKQYESLVEQKFQKAKELLEKRKQYRIFYYLKIGTVYSRIGYLDKQIINIVHVNTFKMKIMLEWCRRIHLDRSIKTKVAQMLNNKSTKLNASFVNMSKMQIDDYFSSRISESKDRIKEELVNLRLERGHYQVFIKNETNAMKSKIDHKYPLKLRVNTKAIFQFNTFKLNRDDEIFSAARKHLSLSFESEFIQKKGNENTSHPHEFLELLKSHNRKNSFDRVIDYTSYKEPESDLEKSLAQKELIHRSFHNFKSSYSASSQSPKRSTMCSPRHETMLHNRNLSLVDLKDSN